MSFDTALTRSWRKPGKTGSLRSSRGWQQAGSGRELKIRKRTTKTISIKPLEVVKPPCPLAILYILKLYNHHFNKVYILIEKKNLCDLVWQKNTRNEKNVKGKCRGCGEINHTTKLVISNFIIGLDTCKLKICSFLGLSVCTGYQETRLILS